IVLIAAATSSTWPKLLGGNVGDQVVERPRALPAAEVERLERVVHERGHLAEAPTHELLNGGVAGRVGIGRRRQLHRNSVVAKDHGGSLRVGGRSRWPTTGLPPKRGRYAARTKSKRPVRRAPTRCHRRRSRSLS